MTHGYFSIRRHDSWILSRHQPACKVHDCVQKRDLLILASTHFLRDVITFYTAAHVCCRHTCVFGSVRSTQWEAKRKSSQQSRGESFFLRKVPQTWFVGDWKSLQYTPLLFIKETWFIGRCLCYFVFIFWRFIETRTFNLIWIDRARWFSCFMFSLFSVGFTTQWSKSLRKLPKLGPGYKCDSKKSFPA